MKTSVLRIVKGALGFIWVGVFAAFGVMIFMGIGSWTEKLLKEPGVEIIPKFDGGKVIKETASTDYLLLVHEPVHDGVFVKSKTTYVQVEWLAKEKLPDRIVEDIDYDMDGAADVKVSIDTVNGKISCDVLNKHVSGLVARSSLAGFRMQVDKANKDVLFFIRNMTYKETTYGEGLSVRLIVEP